jgi:malate permease and related proteins
LNSFLVFSGLLLLVAVLLQRLPMAASLADQLNWWVLNIALPAMVLELIPKLQLDPHLWYLVLSQWLGFALSVALFVPLGRVLRWSRERLASVLLLASLSNTAFVGLPLVGALRGEQALPLVMFADQLGCFIALSVGGAVLVAVYSGGQASPRQVLNGMLRFPPFAALLVALLVHAAGGWPTLVSDSLHRVSVTLAPIAMFSVGLRLRLRPVPGERSAMALAIAWKLLLMPLVTWTLGLALGIHGLALTVSVLETAMAPMFSSVMIARANDFDPDFADATLSIGLLLSFVTVPAWSLLLP